MIPVDNREDYAYWMQHYVLPMKRRLRYYREQLNKPLPPGAGGGSSASGGGGVTESISFKVGNFTGNGTTSTQAVTGVGFQPKVLIILGTSGSVGAFSTNSTFTYGFANSTDQIALGVNSRDAQAAAENYRVASDADIIDVINATGTQGARASLTSLDSDGFTLTWSTSSTAVYGYIAIAGDITSDIGTITSPGSATTQNVSTSLVNADFTMLAGTSLAFNETSSAEMVYSYGFATDSNQGTLSLRDISTSSPTDSYSYMDTSLIYSQINASGILSRACSFTGHTATGFDLNWTVDPATVDLAYLTIKGGNWQVGSGTTGVSQSSVSYTTSFQPKGIGMISDGRTDAFGTTALTDARGSMGFSDGTDDFSHYVLVDDNVGTTATDKRTETSNIYINSDLTPTLTELATVSAFNTTNFTLNYSTNNASDNRFIWFACGDV